MAVAAGGYDGSRTWRGDGAAYRMWDEGALRKVMLNDSLTEEERAEAVRAHIEAAHDEANEQLEACATAAGPQVGASCRRRNGRKP